jgi:hypothetical protein
MCMKEILFGPGEIIYSVGDTDERIFHIHKGTIELYLEKGIPEKRNKNSKEYELT